MQVDFDGVCRNLYELTFIQPSSRQALHSMRSWGLLWWAQCVNTAEKGIKESVRELLRGDKVLQILSHAFADAFTKRTPMNLARFISMQTLVHDILAARVQDSMAAAAPYTDHVMQNAV